MVTAERPRIDSVPFAKVTLTPGSIETRSDSVGRFAFDSVPPGRYSLQVRAFLCKPYTTEIEVASGKTLTVRAALELDEGYTGSSGWA